jgi:TolB protein
MKMINHILGVPLAMVAALVLLTAGPARAVVEIDINRANVEPLPIAITDFISNDATGCADFAAVDPPI